MKSGHLSKLIILILFCSLVTPLITLAQTTTPTATTTAPALTAEEEAAKALESYNSIQNSPLGYAASINVGDIDVNLKPEFPGAFQNISIKLDSNTVDLNHYPIEWTVNGVSMQKGIGLRDFKITSGDYGSSLKIVAIINLGRTVLQKTIVVSPQDATLLWEAIDSYVPPFYRGKKMPGRESLIEISGIPNFKNSADSTKLNDAVYLWTRNKNRVLGVGGYAKDSLIIEQNRLRNVEEITADITSVSGNITARKTITIPTINPEIHWYTKDTFNYRRLASADRGLRIASGDTNLIAEPYFFSLKNSIADFTFQWKINNETIYLDPNAPNNELLVKNPEQTGQASFQVLVNNPKTFLQSASKTVALYFQK